MSHGSFPILKILKHLPDDLTGKVILDAGCGAGEAGFYLRQYVNREWSSKYARKPFRLIGIDAVKENIDRLQELGIYDTLIHEDLTRCDLSRLPKIDISLCLETAEHIEKLDSLKVIFSLTRFSDFVLVSMPHKEKIRFQASTTPEYHHVSRWTRRDLEKMGFRTYLENFYNMSPKLAPIYDVLRVIRKRPTTRELIGVWKRGGFNLEI